MDLFAAEIGMDPAEVRRKNLIAPFSEPHTTSIGQTYDVGDYVGALDRVLAAAGYDELRAEQARRREAGDRVQLGIGVSTYVEITGGVPPFGDAAKIEVRPDGRAIVYTGTSPHGQGHDTSWSMIASAQTGIPIDQIELVWGDTDLVPIGGGTMGSRSLQQGGAAVDKAAVELVERAKAVAAKALEAAESDVVLDLDRGRLPRGRHAGRRQDVGRPRRRGGRRRRPAARRDPLRDRRPDVPVRRPRRRRRGRHRDGPGAPRPPRRLRRRRPGPQPADPRGPDPRRRRPGDGAGAARGGAATTTTATRSRPTSPTTG